MLLMYADATWGNRRDAHQLGFGTETENHQSQIIDKGERHPCLPGLGGYQGESYRLGQR